MQAHSEALHKYFNRAKEAATTLEQLFGVKGKMKDKICRAVEFATTEFTPTLQKKKDARSQAAAGDGGSMQDTKLPLGPPSGVKPPAKPTEPNKPTAPDKPPGKSPPAGRERKSKLKDSPGSPFKPEPDEDPNPKTPRPLKTSELNL